MTQWCNVLRAKIVQITPFSEEPTESEVRSITSKNFWNQPSRNRRWKTAPPPS